MADTGDKYGAVRLSSLEELYPRQREVAKQILTAVHAVAYGSYSQPRRHSSRDRGVEPDSYDRPHNAYVIDGARGSGKTTLLLTLQRFLSAMTLDCARLRGDTAEEVQVAEQLRLMGLSKPSQAAGSERVALVLPIVFLEDMEPAEATMEAIFAHMERQLEREIAVADGEAGETLRSLQDELRREIGLAWTYSRRIGVEALANDALDYGDFVMRRAWHNRQAYMRIERWHAFVAKFLDEIRVQTLVLLFDDSDLNVAAAEDILGAIRMYLSHPKIVSIVAVELLTLQSTILGRKLPAQRHALEVLNLLDSNAANRMLEDVRRNTMALIDKVLPVNLRHRLANEDMRHLDHFFRNQATADGQDRFETWCLSRFEAKELSPKTKLAWFLLGKPYRRLIAENVRRTIAFREETAPLGADPVAALLRFFGLHDLPIGDDVDSGELELAIVERQIAAEWYEGGSSTFVEQDGEIIEVEEDSGPRVLTGIGLTFVEFWLDLQIAAGKLDFGHLDAVLEWLPTSQLADESLAVAEDFGKTLGVAGVVPKAPLPRNCLYLYQFRRLSGVALKQLPGPSGWTSFLNIWADESPDFGLSAKALMDDIRVADDEQAIAVLGKLSSVVRSNSYRHESDPSNRGPRLALALYGAAASEDGLQGFIRLLAAVSDGGDGADALAGFLGRLEKAYVGAERARQEALFTWACALEVAQTGDDTLRLRASLPRRHLAIEFAAAYSRARFPELVGPTVECLAKSNRHALLLAWSVGPLLGPLHDLGSVHAEADDTAAAWTQLAGAYRGLVEGLAARKSADGIDGTPTAGGWEYADFDPGDLSRIVDDVSRTASMFDGRLEPSKAGARRTPSAWPEDPADLVAGILGTSVEWTKVHLVPAG